MNKLRRWWSIFETMLNDEARYNYIVTKLMHRRLSREPWV